MPRRRHTMMIMSNTMNKPLDDLKDDAKAAELPIITPNKCSLVILLYLTASPLSQLCSFSFSASYFEKGPSNGTRWVGTTVLQQQQLTIPKGRC